MSAPIEQAPMRTAHRGLSIRSLRAVFVGITVIVVGVTYLAVRQYETGIRESASSTVSALAHAQRALLEGVLRERVLDGRQLVVRPAVWAWLTRDLETMPMNSARLGLARAIEQTRETYDYRQITLVDSAARVVYPPAATLDEDVRASLRSVMQARRARVLPFRVDASGLLEYNTVYPVFANGDSTARVVGAALLLQDAMTVLLPQLALLEENRLLRTESVILQVEGDSVSVVAATRSGATLTPLHRRLAMRDFTRVAPTLILAGHDTTVDGLDYRGIRVLAAGQRIAGTPWFVVSKVEFAELADDVRAFALVAWSAAVGLLLLAALVLQGMWRASVHRSERDQLALASRYLAATATSIDGSMLLAADGRLLDANAALAKITGYTQRELLNLSLADLMQSVPAEEVRSWIAELMGRESALFHSQWRRKDGAVIEVDVSASHLPDERGGQLFCFVRDVTEQIETTRRLARHNTMYAFLNRISEALFAARSVQTAYETVVQSALDDGEFQLCWVGVVDEAAGVVRPVAWAGSASAYVRELHITLDPALATSQGPTGQCVRNAQAVVANEFATDSRTAPWHELAREHSLASSAALPVVVDGRVVAAVMFYSTDRHFFSEDLLSTLAELTRLLGLVIQSAASEERRRDEEELRRASEERFRRLFESSPLPMYVMHERTALITRVNRAFTERFGYTLDDIPTAEIQMVKFYPDAAFREQLAELWKQDVARTGEGDAPVQSPDLRVCCKDGTYRDVQGFVSRAGDELVVGWVDLTDQRAMQATLQDAEEIARLGSFSHDFRTNEIRTSPGFLEVLGFPPSVRDAHADANLPWIFNLFHPDDSAEMLSAFLHTRDVDATLRAAPDGGPQRYLRVRVRVEHDAAGVPRRAVGSLQDVTAEVTATRELTRLRDHLQDVVDERTAELAKANATLQAADRRLKAMLAMSQKAATLNEAAILQLGVDEAARLTGSTVGFLHLVTEDQAHLDFGIWSTGTQEHCDVLYDAQYDVHSAATWIAAVQQRTPVLVNRTEATSLTSCPVGHVPLDRFLAVPVLDGDRVCLLLAVGNKGEPYDDTDVQELELIGHDIWSVVQRRRADLALERAYERVKASDERFAFAMEASSEGVWEWDIPRGRFSYNDTYATMLGYAPDEMSKHVDEWAQYLHPDERAAVLASLGASMQTDAPYSNEFRLRAKDGTYRWILARGRVIERDRDHRPVRAVGTHTDLTARRQAEDELRQAKESADAASRAKSAFLATMSHEIRTPLNGVIAMAEILAQSKLPPHDMDAVHTIQSSAHALLAVIDDILDFSKIEAGRLEIDVADVSLTQLAEELCESLLPVARGRGVDLRLYVAPDVPLRVRGDSTRLRQILYNLAGNAIKFSGGRADCRGRVDIRVDIEDRKRHRFAFSVIDNGIGMSDETIARLFTSFTQAEASTTRKFGGTGLGLAITKRLVDLMDGTITVESSLGAGSTFYVSLPLPVVEQAPALVPHDLAGLHCVILERAGGIAASDLRQLLEFAGAQVTVAGSADEAATIARRLDALCVVIHDLNGSHVLESEPLFGDISNVRHLALTRGRRKGERVKVPNLVTLDLEVLRARRLIRAVAVASGRASPEVFHDDETAETPVEAAPPTPASAPTIDAARAGGRLILVAEDDRTNQKVILQQLQLLGHVAEIAGNGAEALAMWRANRNYALLLSDLHMPEMDGYTLTQSIRREERRGEHLPIVALTANALRGEASRATAVGMDGYLTKPVPLASLRELVNRYITPDAAGAAPAGTAASASPTPVPAAAMTAQSPTHRSEDPRMPEPPLVPGEVRFQVLANLVGDDPSVLREFVADFQGSARQLAEEIRAARAAGNLTQVGALAHRLKSSSRSVGALYFGEICAELEQAGKQANAPQVHDAMARFDEELTRVDAALTTYLANA